MLPLTTSLEQHSSPFHNNDFYSSDDLVDDINNTATDNVCVELYNSTMTLTLIIPLMMGASVILIFLSIIRMSVNIIFLLIKETVDLSL